VSSIKKLCTKDAGISAPKNYTSAPQSCKGIGCDVGHMAL